MKSIYFIISVMCTSLFTSCNNDDNSNMSAGLNINYPAAYVVNGEDATISVIRLSDNKVTATIPLMTESGMIMWPHHISTHDGHLALGVPGMDFSAGHAGMMEGMTGKLLIVDAVNGNIIENKNLPSMNHNTIYSPNAAEIWVPQMDMDGKVLVYDADTYELLNTITVGMMPAELTFSANGEKAYVANGEDDTVSVIDVATKTVVATILVGDNPVGAWTGADGRMYVDNEDGQSVSVINVATNATNQTIDLGFMPGIVSHNGSKNELWVSDPMAAKVHYYMWDSGMSMWMVGGVFDAGAGAHAITFTPDGNTAYVTNQTANTVSVVNVSSHSVTKTINVGKKPNGVAIRM